jgi:hypothetical protein
MPTGAFSKAMRKRTLARRRLAASFNSLSASSITIRVVVT